ncbi:MAG: Gfo/Idh/MocA family oxidoreductase [Kiritimatiellae bacterium]|nr:Gfo/Idh/MocA family oxidoreductase [Kiritimatiellia bacterium]
MKTQLQRRGFLKQAAAAVSLPYLIPASALGLNGTVAPSERITVATIGMGDRGPNHVSTLSALKQAQLTTICDVRGDALEQRLDGYTKAGMNLKSTKDFREIMADPSIDVVTIAAPENWHALMTIEAAKNGKDIYCEKALSLTVAEGRAMCETVRRYGRILQAGIQQRSDPRFRQACELALNGYLGKLERVSVAAPSGRRMLKLEPGEVPADIDYDLWLGPAPFKPYRKNLCNYNWYFLTDYCAGWIQSWGVHHLDIGLWGAPEFLSGAIEVEGAAQFEPEGDADVSFGWQVKVKTKSGLVMDYYDDGSSPVGHGVRFIGDKGWVHVTRSGIKASDPALLNTVIKPSDQHLYVSRNHMENFLECVKSRREPIAPVEACHAATMLSLVADIASRVKRPLKWDWKAEQFVGDDFANRMLSRTMRAPWQL